MMQVFLSAEEVAKRLGLSAASSLPRNTLPEPDAKIGRARGWLPETIDRWNAGRPGHGGRPPKSE